jgi:hypothetical protein
MTTQVFEFNILQIIPNAFIRVRVGGITRQLFQMKSFGRTLAQKLFNRLAPMSRQAIPDEQQLALKTMQQMFEKTNHPWPPERLFLGPGEQFTVAGYGADDRQVFPRARFENRRLASGCISPHRPRQQIKTGFIYEYYGSFFTGSFFFNASHFWLRHCSMATSLRWLARLSGFWRLQPIFLSRLPTCSGVYTKPNSRLMTSLTRPRLQTSPRKPCASAPWANNYSSRFRSLSLKPGLGPPPVRLRRVSAILTAFQPACFNSQARIRRASRQSCGCFAFSFTIHSLYHRFSVLFNKSLFAQ